jgi:hypothetical protein
MPRRRQGKKGRRKTAVPILDEKFVDSDGGITQLMIWQVPGSRHGPEGIKYRCAYIIPSETQPAVLYDVHHGKSHHRHVQGVESRYEFRGVSELLKDFAVDVDRIKSRKRG